MASVLTDPTQVGHWALGHLISQVVLGGLCYKKNKQTFNVKTTVKHLVIIVCY